MSRSDRMFEIIQRLRRAKTPLTAQQLATDLEVTTRTIYRDIAVLQGQRVPVEGEAGIGYILRPGYDLPPLMFDSDELQALAMGLSLLRRTGDTGLGRAADTAFDKILSVLPEDDFDTPLYASGWHSVPPSVIDPETIRRAIRDEAKLRIDYCDVAGVVSERTILPLALVYYIGSQVIAAWCELRRDFRHFRIDRINGCVLTEQHFKGHGEALRRQWSEAHSIE